MPTDEEHIAHALHAQELIDFLLPQIDRFSDWVAVAAFYEAVHLIDAVLYTKNKSHGTSHTDRENQAKKDGDLKKIYRHYHALKSASMVSRYLEGYDCFKKYMSADTVIMKLLKYHLCEIRRAVKGLLRASVGKNL